MIVVDVNVLAYLLLDEGHRCNSSELLYAEDPDWMMPRLWRDEFLNILVTQIRFVNLHREIAIERWFAAQNEIGIREQDISAHLILEVAENYGLTAYDAHYVALAKSLGVKLYTYDKQILRSCSHIAAKPK